MPIPVSPVDTSLREGTHPVITTAPSTSKVKGKSNVRMPVGSNKKKRTPSFNVIPTCADLKLPAEIFASDDSDTGFVTAEEVPVQLVMEDNAIREDTVPMATSRDKMVGGINIKVERLANNNVKPSQGKKNKNTKAKQAASNASNLQNIKTELQDDFEWNDMSLATLNNNSDHNSLQSV